MNLILNNIILLFSLICCVTFNLIIMNIMEINKFKNLF